MLAGKPPFEAEDLPAFLAMELNEPAESLVKRAPKAAVPPDLDRLVLTMLEDSDSRPWDAGALAGRPRPVRRRGRRRRPGRRRLDARRRGGGRRRNDPRAAIVLCGAQPLPHPRTIETTKVISVGAAGSGARAACLAASGEKLPELTLIPVTTLAPS